MIKVNTQTLVATRGGLPSDLRGLNADTLRNLQSALNPVPEHLVNIEFWPEVDGDAPIDSGTQYYGAEVLAANPADKTVIVTHEIVNRTAQEIADRLTQRKAERSAECLELAKQKRDSVVTGVSAGEMASWPIKREQANAYLAKGILATDDDAPALAAEAVVRGVSTVDIVNRVFQNASDLLNIETQIAGVSGLHRDAIAAMTTVSAVNAYDITTDWPV